MFYNLYTHQQYNLLVIVWLTSIVKYNNLFMSLEMERWKDGKMERGMNE